MKVIFYGRHQIGQAVLLQLIALGHTVKVLTPEDEFIRQIVMQYGLPVIDLDKLSIASFDLFICVHGKKIIPSKYLVPTKFINLHPCIMKYPGKDPIKRYIQNQDQLASVTSHYMTEKVDAGEKLKVVYFNTPILTTREEFYMFAMPYYLQVMFETLRLFEVTENTYVTN